MNYYKYLVPALGLLATTSCIKQDSTKLTGDPCDVHSEAPLNSGPLRSEDDHRKRWTRTQKSNGTAVSDADVSLEDGANNYSGQTNGNGYWEEDVIYGIYHLVVSKPGFHTIDTNIDLSTGAMDTVVVNLVEEE